jgi:hypothetical protein
MKVFFSIQKNPASENPGVYKPMELTRRIGVSDLLRRVDKVYFY